MLVHQRVSISILTNPDRDSSDHLQIDWTPVEWIYLVRVHDAQIDWTPVEWIYLVRVHDAKTGYQGQCPVIQGIWSWFPQCKRGAPEKEQP